MNLHQDDARMAALRRMYPHPPSSTAVADDAFGFRPNVPIDLRYTVFRTRESGPSAAVFTVDPLFPMRLKGRADMSGVDEGTADFLYGLVRALAPRVVLETGTHKGRSTRAIAQALYANANVEVLPHSYMANMAAGHCYTVDAEDHRIFDLAIPPEAQAYVTPIVGWTPDVFMQPPLEGLTGIEFAFLDGDHTAEGLDAELQYVDLHRADECWVAIDNSRDAAWPGIRRVLSDYTKYPQLSLATCVGLDLIWMSGSRSPRGETASGGARTA